MTREPGDRPCIERCNKSVGDDGKGTTMTTMTKTATTTTAAQTNILTITFVALLGAAMVFLAGHAQSSVLHDAAHDVRHVAGFPCH